MMTVMNKYPVSRIAMIRELFFNSLDVDHILSTVKVKQIATKWSNRTDAIVWIYDQVK